MVNSAAGRAARHIRETVKPRTLRPDVELCLDCGKPVRGDQPAGRGDAGVVHVNCENPDFMQDKPKTVCPACEWEEYFSAVGGTGAAQWACPHLRHRRGEHAMTDQDDTAIVAAVEEAVREVILSQSLRWPDIARAAIAALDAHRAASLPDEVQSRIAYLYAVARFFEQRPTGGEDRAHWANVYNAENARKAADTLEAEHAARVKAEAELAEALKALAPFARYAKRELDQTIPRHIQDDPNTPVLGSGLFAHDDAVEVFVSDFQRAAAFVKAAEQTAAA